MAPSPSPTPAPVLGLRPDRVPAPWAALLAAVLPVRCAGCGRPDAPLCRSCARALRPPAGRSRPAAGLLVDPGALGCPPTAAVTAYADPVPALLAAWKERGRHDLVRWLAPALGESVLAVLELLPPGPAGTRPGAPAPSPAGRSVLLVPVPSARRAVRARGEDVVAALAAATAAGLRGRGVPVRAAPVLRPVRGLRDSSGLSATSRAVNLAGAHGVRRSARLDGRLCVVVDDVVTTGASLAEASRALAAAGAVVVGGAAVAATVRAVPATGRRGGGAAPSGVVVDGPRD